MKCILVVCVIISLTSAAVVPSEAQAEIISAENINSGTGKYIFSFSTSNGITREESGQLVKPGSDDEYVRVQGSYTYRDPEGNLVRVRYVADESGFHILEPIDPSLPVAAALPAHVVATLLGK